MKQTTLAPERTERHLPRARRRVAVHQDVDLASVGPFSHAVVVALEQGASTVVLDMTACAFVDLTGHRLLRGLREHVEAAGGGVVLEGLTPRVRRQLELLDDLVGCRAVAPARPADLLVPPRRATTLPRAPPVGQAA